MHPDVNVQSAVFPHVSLADLEKVAAALIGLMGSIRVCILTGEMGSGKTTLIKAIGRVLAVEDTMSSPTFSLVNEYRTKAGNNVYHFDLYRLKSEQEAFDVGVEEYFYSGNYCFVEWPEKVSALLPDTYAEIKIEVVDSAHRKIEFLIHG